ncbi:MAG: hypothetical protein ABSD99_00090 [Candidatus Bathyarchaeia archaeon]|jgi:hypothetical protein
MAEQPENDPALDDDDIPDFDELEEPIYPQPPLPIPHETAAFQIARILIVGFLITLIAPLALFINNPAITVSPVVVDIIKTESAVLSGIVGAVVGYYYRFSTEKPK